jgi:hypothetical protein
VRQGLHLVDGHARALSGVALGLVIGGPLVARLELKILKRPPPVLGLRLRAALKALNRLADDLLVIRLLLRGLLWPGARLLEVALDLGGLLPAAAGVRGDVLAAADRRRELVHRVVHGG